MEPAVSPGGAISALKEVDRVEVASARVRGDLERFKQFIEERGHETGAWRGSINAPHS